MNLKELKKMIDVVYVDLKEWKKICDYWKKNSPLDVIHNNKKLFFPLNTFILDVDLDKTTKLFGLVELTDHLILSYRFTSDKMDMTVKRMNNGWDIQAQDKTNVPHTYKQTQEYAEVCNTFIIGILLYIYIKSNERRKEERISPAIIKEHNSSEPYNDRELYFLKDIVTYVVFHPNKTSITYHKDVWGVRGHIRHLQNGDMIFIKPFKKGRMRLTKEPESRTYLIERNFENGQSEK